MKLKIRNKTISFLKIMCLSGFQVIEFDTPSIGISTPVFRNNPGFVSGGKTAGGAREFAIPNVPISQLRNVQFFYPQ